MCGPLNSSVSSDGVLKHYFSVKDSWLSEKAEAEVARERSQQQWLLESVEQGKLSVALVFQRVLLFVQVPHQDRRKHTRMPQRGITEIC